MDTMRPVSYVELKHQRDELARQMEAMREGEVEAFKKRVVEEAATLEVDLSALLRTRRGGRNAAPRKPAVPKYRDPDTGETWSGKGLPAGWLQAKLDAGEDKETYRVT